MSCRLEVQLTYAENPNYFYFRIQSEEFAIQIRQIEHEMRRYVHQKNEHRMLGPTIGSIVGFHHKKWDRWVRVRIDEVADSTKPFKFFLLDYGHFSSCKDGRRFTELPKEFQRESPRIKLGALRILPATPVIDPMSKDTIAVPAKFWHPLAIEMLQSYSKRNDAFQIFFMGEQQADGTWIGDVEVTSGDRTISICVALLCRSLAVLPDDQQVKVTKEEGRPQTIAACVNAGSNIDNREVVQYPTMKPKLEIPRESSPKGEESDSSQKGQGIARASSGGRLRNPGKAEGNLKGRRVSPTSLKDPGTSKATSKDPVTSAASLKDPSTSPAPPRHQTATPAGLKNSEKSFESSKVLGTSTANLKDPTTSFSSSKNPRASPALPWHQMTPPASKNPEKSSTSQINPKTSSKLRQSSSKQSRASPPSSQSSTSQSPPKTEEPPATPPSDIMAFGPLLRAPVLSVDGAPFSPPIKKYFKSFSADVTNLQSHCWAQIHHGRSMVIVAKDALSKKETRLAYLLPILDKILKNRQHETEAMGPIAFIAARTSCDVQMIAKLITGADAGLSVVELFGASDKKAELMNGCDVLVTTPQAFRRLVERISLKIIDKERVKFVVFDGVDAMLPAHESELGGIVKTCTSQPDKNPQVVVTAAEWMKEIEFKFASLVQPNHLVVCIESFIEAAAFAGCKVAMEASGSEQEMIAQLAAHLSSGAYKTKRTVVLTKDLKSSKVLAEKLAAGNVAVSLANDENFTSVKISWPRKTKDFNVLVTSDKILAKMNLRCGLELIHFGVPASWTSFSNRFALLLDQIYAHLANKTAKNVPCTKILLDDANGLEFTQLIKFLHARKLAMIPDALIESVEQTKLDLKLKQEAEKAELNIKVCDNIWQFGECKKLSCSSRHVFKDSDQPSPHLPTQNLVKFKIISAESPTSFVIEIQAHMDGKKWISWEERNLKLQQVLENDLQEFYGSAENRVKAKTKLGETYAVRSGEKWQRCKLLELKMQVALVHLIDTGSLIRCTELLEMPNDLKNLEPLVCHLRIVNLVPFDGEEVWEETAKLEFIEKLLKNVEGSICTCKVEMALQNILFANSFDAKDTESGRTTLRLKEKLVKANIGQIGESVGEKLRKFAKVHQKTVNEVTEIEEKEIFEEPFAVAEPLVPEVAQENWKQLSWGACYVVRVSHFVNPESFLVTVDRTDQKLLQKFQRELESCETRKPLSALEVGAVCGVEHQKFRRGKIMKACGDDFEVLLVDDGEVFKCRKSQLFELPAELKAKVSFQSIHCRMVGVKPKFNMQTWPPKQSGAVRHLISSCEGPMKVFVMKNNEKMDELSQLGMKSFDVVLIDSSNDSHIDEIAVAMRVVDRDDVEKPKDLEDVINDQHIVEVDNEEVGEDYADVEVLRKLLEMEYIGEAESSDDECGMNGMEQPTEPPALENSKTPAVEQSVVPSSPISSLRFIHKHPKIEWRQNAVMIYLLISAANCEDYTLNVDDSSMDITIKYSETGCEQAAFKFYSTVDSTMTSHEQRGLNIVVRLVKANFHDDWPRLTESKEKSQFIRFSIDKISTEGEAENRVSSFPATGTSKYSGCGPDVYGNDSDADGLSLSEAED